MIDPKNSDTPPETADEMPPGETKGHWGAHVGGFCAVVFALAGGHVAANLMNSKAGWQAGLVVLFGTFVANEFGTMAGHMAGAEFKDPADVRKVANFTRSMILFASLATGFMTFAASSEAEKCKTQLHDAAPVKESVQPLPSPHSQPH